MLLPAVAPLVLVLALAPTRASRMEGDVLIPSSSIEVPENIGVRMHSNHVLVLGPAMGLGQKGGIEPSQMYAFYHTPSSGGQGVIAVVDPWDYPSALYDFNLFSQTYGLSQETGGKTVFEVVYATGSVPDNSQAPPDDPPSDWNQEAALDIQWAHAMAPGAKVVLVEAATDDDSDLFYAVQQAARITGVQEVSMSWASTEFDGETSYDGYFGGTTGPIFFGAAGDSGGVVQYPACSQYVVCVGGTSVTTDDSGNWQSEMAWSEGGGGTSQYVAKPFWQLGVPLITGGRGVPDIACNSDNKVSPVSVYISADGWVKVGGTSVAAPCMAGMVNVSCGVNSATFTNTTQFLANLYENNLKNTDPFQDITTGSTSSTSGHTSYGFNALPGWDFCTGVGTPDGTGSFFLNTPAAAYTGLDVLNALANFGVDDTSLTQNLTGDTAVSLNDVDFMLLQMGW